MGNKYIKSKVVGHKVKNNNQSVCRQTCACDQLTCASNTYNVHEAILHIPKENECMVTKLKNRVRKLNKQCAIKNANNNNPSLT